MALKKKKSAAAKKSPAKKSRVKTKITPKAAAKKTAPVSKGRGRKSAEASPPASLMQTDPTALEIIRRIRATFSPTFMKLENQTAQHASHKGKGPGNHYEVKIVSDLFNGLTLLQRSHWVNSVFSDLFGKAIHALKLDLKSPQETPLPEYQPPPLARQSQSKLKPKK